MDWIGGGREAAGQGHDVVMTPTAYCYFDYYQDRDHAVEPRAMGGYLPLAKVYAFEPVPPRLAPEMQRHILGGQGNVWTEYIPNLKHLEYMAFPRLCALAEATWSPPQSRNFEDFTRRLRIDNRRLDLLGVNYRHETTLPIGGWTPAQIHTTAATLEWDVTKEMTAAGKRRVSLNHTQGVCGINIAWVALLEDGQEISRDTHRGFAGANPRQPVYTLDMPAPKAGASYALRAEVTGSCGTDSTGIVSWDLKPILQSP
jgi:hexosaminidase